MATSRTEIYNLALAHLGVGKRVSSIDERTKEAEVCSVFYDQCVEEMLRDFAYPFASTIVTLGLVEENPNDEWAYSYRYPSDCVTFTRILSGNRDDTQDSTIPYKISSDDSGILIFTDVEDAQAEYTSRITNVQLFPGDFVSALSFLLASYVAPTVTGGDYAKIRDDMFKYYQMKMNIAQAKSSNEQQLRRKQIESEATRAKEGETSDTMHALTEG